MSLHVELVGEPFDPAISLKAFHADPSCGAKLHFIGQVRRGSQENPVDHLVIEHYPGMTEASFKRVCLAAAEQHGLVEVLAVHRYGLVRAGEPIVLVAVAAPHRAQAFAGCAMIVEHLKLEVPFWKKEVGPVGERWVSPAS